MILFLGVGLAGTAVAGPDPSRTCRSAKSSKWSPQEVWAWGQLCSRHEADLGSAGQFGSAGDMTSGENWAPSRTISSDFIEEILTIPRFAEELGHRGIIIRGAFFPDAVSLRDASLPAVYLLDSYMKSSIDLVGSTVAGNLSLGGSSVGGDITANGLTTEGAILLTYGTYQGVDLTGARVATGIEVTNALVHGKMTLVSARDDGYVNLNNSVFEGGVDASELVAEMSFGSVGTTYGDQLLLGSAKIGTDLRLDNSQFDGGVDASSIALGGSLFIHGTTIDQNLSLSAASVGGVANLRGSTYKGDVNANGLIVGNGLLAYSSFFGGGLDLGTAQVKDQINLSHSELHAPVSLNGCVIDGALVLGGVDGPARWYGESQSLDLGGATVKGIDDSPGSWPTMLILSGFNFSQAQGRLSGEQSFTDRPASWYTTWLHRDHVFPRQAYGQLENLLRAAGRTGEANAVGLERSSREYASSSGALRRLLGPVHYVTVGYGYHPEIALLWTVLLIGLGAAVAKKIPQSGLDAQGATSRLILSAHRLIPLISFGKSYGEVDVTSKSIPRVVRWYFYVHAVLGYVLAAALVSAVAGVTTISGAR